MKEGLEPEKHRIYERKTRGNTGFMKEGLDPTQYRIYEGRTRA